MDSISQIVLGAGVGELVLGRKVGNKAPLWGAIAGTIPDLDVIPGSFLSTVDQLSFHRGFSHSIVFFLLLAPLLGWAVNKLYKNERVGWKHWTLLFFLSLFTHALLDCFTTWGTQLFWPLNTRVAWKSIFVIDPLYTVPFLICVLWLLFRDRLSRARRILGIAGIAISCLYLAVTLVNKYRVNHVFETALARQRVEFVRYDSRPTAFNNILWSVNIETTDAYLIGYYSFFDDDEHIDFLRFAKRHELIEPYLDDPDLRKLVNITENWYTMEIADGVLIVNDLRFGMAEGWDSEDGEFVFSYIVRPERNDLSITQKENTFEDTDKLMAQLWVRLKGT